MQTLTTAQLERLFRDPLGEYALRYTESLHESIALYDNLLQIAPIGYYVRAFNKQFLQKAYQVTEQHLALRRIILRDGLDVVVLYNRVIEQGFIWMRIRRAIVSLMVGLGIRMD